MLFSILVGILSVFCFACGFLAFTMKDISAIRKFRTALIFFSASLALAYAVRFI